MSLPNGDDAAGSSDDHRDKRPRIAFTDFADYARDVINRSGLRNDEGDHEGVEIVEDIMAEPDGYSDVITKVTDDVDLVLVGLGAPSKVRKAFIIVRWLCDSHVWEKSVLNDCVLSKFLLGNDARAHIDGVYLTVFGVWSRQQKFTLKHVRDMTDVMVLARAYMSALITNHMGSRWSDASAFLTTDPAILADGVGYDLETQEKEPEDPEEPTSRWPSRVKTLMRYQKEFLGTQGNLNHIISTMANYFQEARQQEPVVTCEDACLRLHWGAPYEQIDHAASNNCYIRIPASIACTFSTEDEQRQDLFISTCFWNKRGISARTIHDVDLSYTCLTLAGTRPTLPAVAIALHGSGENGKTMWGRSKVRLFGGETGGCDFVDPAVLFNKEEFRINMGHYLNFLGLVWDEAGDTGNAGKGSVKKLDASVIKLLLDRKKVIVRAPYAKEAGEHSWPRTAFYLLSNTFPSIPEQVMLAFKAWFRRFLVFPFDSSYVVIIDDADPEHGIFLMDTDLDNFVSSGLFAAMYLKRYVQQHLRTHTEIECIHTCRHPGTPLDEYRKEIIGAAMTQSEDGGVHSTAGEGKPNPQTSDSWRHAALRLVRAGIFSFVATRASKMVQLGPAKTRLQELASFKAAGHFYQFKVSRGERIAYKMPIGDVPQCLKAESFQSGKLGYDAALDFEAGWQCIEGNQQFAENRICQMYLQLGERLSHSNCVAYKNPGLLGRRFTTSCGAALLPKRARKAFYSAHWILVDTVNCDIRIMWGVKQLLLPSALLPRLDRLAHLDTRDQMLIDLGKSKKEVNAIARGQAMSEDDKDNKLLMDLRDEIRVANQILEAYRPDVVEDAKARGKPVTSAHAKICQILEDQQIQCLEEAMVMEGILVGDVIYDALMVQRCEDDRLQRAMDSAEALVKDRLGLDAKFKVESWPDDDQIDIDMDEPEMIMDAFDDIDDAE